MTMFGKQLEKNGLYFYFVFRVFVGLLFALHGAQKLFGWFGGMDSKEGSVALFSLMGLAGVVEFFGGLLVAVGLLARLAALLGVVQMLAAYFMAHASKGLVPLAMGGNGGELALLYFASFLVILAYGAGLWGIEKAVRGKELF